MTLLAGVDAGAAHTVALIGTQALAELSRATGAPGSVAAGNVADAAQAIAAAVRAALGNTQVDDPIAVLTVGAAGTRLDADREALATALRGMDLASDVEVTSDASIALESVFPDSPGILLLAGTGSIAHARDPAGNVRRVGGLGWRIGDEGGGYALGRVAVSAAIMGHERRGPATQLTEKLLQAAGVSDAEQIPTWVRRADVPTVAKLATTVCDVADSGDEVANDLVAEASQALADHVIALLTHFCEGEEVSVVLGGGLIGSDTAVRQRTLTELGTRAPQARVLHAEVDPAAGALRMAVKRLPDLK